jgi:hypothetical protein
MDIRDIQVEEIEDFNGKKTYQVNVNYTTFVFDKKGIKLFLDKFIIGASEVTTEEGYLVRIKEGKTCSFHKYYKLYGTGYDWTEVAIHHRNGDITDNRAINLRIMGKNEHSEFHTERREKNRHRARISSAYQTYKEKYLESNPDATPQTINYFWARFKEKHDID